MKIIQQLLILSTLPIVVINVTEMYETGFEIKTLGIIVVYIICCIQAYVIDKIVKENHRIGKELDMWENAYKSVKKK